MLNSLIVTTNIIRNGSTVINGNHTIVRKFSTGLKIVKTIIKSGLTAVRDI